MSMGPKQAFTANIVSNTTSAATIDLGDKGHDMWSVNTGIPGAVVNIFGAATATGTPTPIYVQVANTNTVAPAVAFAALQLATSTSGTWATFPAPPFRYVTIAATATCANGCIVTIMAS